MADDHDIDELDEERDMDMDEAIKSIQSNEVKELKSELNRLLPAIIAPPMFPLPPVKCPNPDDYPNSYRFNTKKEELVIEFVDNFKRQFQYVYPDRRPLFLTPLNECGVEKFVCTTIRPTTLAFSDIYDWEQCSRFVSDYLQYESLASPTEYPEVLWSPTKTLKDQRGNCFNYSILLASLLVGAGYDAYVVCGYASKEICNMDESRTLCPLLMKTEEKKVEIVKKETGKYSIKAPRDLNSKYLFAQEEKLKKLQQEELEKMEKEKEEALASLEKPPPDALFGLRIHSWVLVLSGKREVPETFFIEALSGVARSTKDEGYLGIESVWNHTNYWVNMQRCDNGTAGLIYDLGDGTKWEFLLPSNEKPLLSIPKRLSDNDETNEEEVEEEDDKEVEKHMDLPPSWVVPLEITPKDFERRCPEGKKVVYYKKCKVEKFAPYSLKDNLILKISEYVDQELKELKRVTERFMERIDKLEERTIDFTSGYVVEKFGNGRSRHLKEHKYLHSKSGPENERIMLFYDEARIDGLKSREETPTEMIEHYVKRSDFLYYRKVIFGKRLKKFGPQDGDNFRPIVVRVGMLLGIRLFFTRSLYRIHTYVQKKIIEKYHRNVEKEANDDIAELIYNIETEKFQITYHRESTKIASSTRDFTKPQNWADKGNTWTWNADLHSTYQAGSEFKPKKSVELYQMLVSLLEKEENVRNAVRKSEEEVRAIINDRLHEESVSELTVSIYDTERNDKARKYESDLEKKLAEEKLRKQTFEADYLAPFLAERGINNPSNVTQALAIELKEKCLNDLKQRIIDKANLIQRRFEKENAELQKKQHWYQANQVNMSKEDEQEYVDYCAEAMFRIHMLELRLNRHKEMAPLKYAEMEQRLRSDTRLVDFLTI